MGDRNLIYREKQQRVRSDLSVDIPCSVVGIAYPHPRDFATPSLDIKALVTQGKFHFLHYADEKTKAERGKD